MRCRFHDLRHTSVALAIAAGAHPKAIQVRMGHSSITVTLDRYRHLFPELDAAIATAFDEQWRAHSAAVWPGGVHSAQIRSSCFISARHAPSLHGVDFLHPVEAVIPGAQGRILAVLAKTTGELNLRTIARLAGVSSAQASRVLPPLVALGLVERREAPPSALFRLVREHVAARAVIQLAEARELVLQELSGSAAELDVAPVSVLLFGSFARAEAVAGSDIDVLVVRPDDVYEDDPGWRRGLDEWTRRARRVTGNRVELLEVPQADVARRLRSGRPLWLEVQRDAVPLFGRDLASLKKRLSA